MWPVFGAGAVTSGYFIEPTRHGIAFGETAEVLENTAFAN